MGGFQIMYEIYTTLYGIDIGESLNKWIQEEEFSELFADPEIQALKGSCDIDIPYSGAGLPDFHFGIVISSNTKDVIFSVTGDQKAHFEWVRNEFIKRLKAVVEETYEQFPEDGDWDEDKIKEFYDKIENGTPGFYRAYSTS